MRPLSMRSLGAISLLLILLAGPLTRRIAEPYSPRSPDGSPMALRTSAGMRLFILTLPSTSPCCRWPATSWTIATRMRGAPSTSFRQSQCTAIISPHRASTIKPRSIESARSTRRPVGGIWWALTAGRSLPGSDRAPGSNRSLDQYFPRRCYGNGHSALRPEELRSDRAYRRSEPARHAPPSRPLRHPQI